MVKQSKNRCWEHIIYDGKEYPCRIVRGKDGEPVVIGSNSFEQVLRPFKYTEDERDYADDEAQAICWRITAFVNDEVLKKYNNRDLVNQCIRDDLWHLQDFVNGKFDIRTYFNEEYPIRLFTDNEGMIFAVGTMDLLDKAKDDSDEAMAVDNQIFYYVDNEKIAWEDKDLIKYIFNNCDIQLKPIIEC